MVFSSIPAYLDPSNWNQHQNHHIIGSSSANPLLPPPPHPGPPPPPPPSQPHGGGGGIRPGSMAERARMANIPMPETSLKCPRCDSTNTKFCYFNNYSLSQPRHFCKTCRRYWTRGGALRSVPVGGGCRRNKRTKSSSSKSPASSVERQTNNSCSTSTASTNSAAAAAVNMLGLTPPQLPPLRFMSPLGQFTDNFTADMGLNYSGMAASTVGTSETMNFHGAGNFLGSGGMASLLSSEASAAAGGGGGGIEPWRLQQAQQFPFLGGLDYQFHGGEPGFLGGEASHQRPKLRPPVKIEDNGENNNLRRQILGGNEQWNPPTTANWTDLSSFSSSSTSNPL